MPMSLVNGIEIVQYQGSFVDFWELTHIYIVPYKQAVPRVGYTGEMFGEGLIFHSEQSRELYSSMI